MSCNTTEARLSFWSMAPQMLNINDAAAALSLHPQTVRAMIKRGDLAAVQIGRHWKIPVSALEKFEAVATANTATADATDVQPD